jgi:stress response protein SCP2
MQGQEAQAGAAGMITAELERHGEQWRVKQMHYTAE